VISKTMEDTFINRETLVANHARPKKAAMESMAM